MTEHDQDAGAPAWLTLHQTAALVGGYRWMESRLFEVVGGWVQTTAQLDAKLLFGRQSRHFAAHAELWLDRLPTLNEMTPANLTVPPTDEVAAFFDRLALLEGTGFGSGGDVPADDQSAADVAVRRLVAVHRVVLPLMIAAYRDHLDRCSAVADAAVMRSLNLVLADAVADRDEGEQLLSALIDPSTIELAEPTQRDLSAEFAALMAGSGIDR